MTARMRLLGSAERSCRGADGLLARRLEERPPRDEYHLTAKGRNLEPVLLGLLRWGDRHAAPHGPPLLLTHTACGHELEPVLVCAHCQQPLTPGSVEGHVGPGATGS